MYKNLYIHIGLPKTGSSFLQKRVFPFLDAHYIPYESEYGRVGVRVLMLKYSNDTPVLVSDEGLYGNVWNNTDYFTQNFTIIDRLKRLYPGCNIIAVFREKDDWLKSIYREVRRKANRFHSFDEFIDAFPTCMLEFEKYKEYVQKNFNSSLFLNFEDLKKDSDGFIRSICDFMDIPFIEYDKRRFNVALKEKHLRVIGLVNGFFTLLNEGKK